MEGVATQPIELGRLECLGPTEAYIHFDGKPCRCVLIPVGRYLIAEPLPMPSPIDTLCEGLKKTELQFRKLVEALEPRKPRKFSERLERRILAERRARGNKPR